MEIQRGVCGDLAPTPYLARAAAEVQLAPTVARLLAGARGAGVTVVHCVFTIRPDRAGTDLTVPIMAAAAADPTLLRQGDPSAELLDGLGPEPGDWVAERHHGLTPFTGTDLADRLRTAGITTVVACGVSLNVGIPGLVTEAVGCGLGAVVATDAVVGIPSSYGADVLRHSLGYIADLVTVDDIIGGWNPGT
jgi:nicotinamidase-related amidase